MKNLWNNTKASSSKNLLQTRVYSSQLLGLEPDLVMHGGGNTSVKITEKNIFGEGEEILYVKGSGWDLATIKKEGFAPVRMNTLLKMSEMDHLSDSVMVNTQWSAMTNPMAPNPSIEAILHAIIPARFVDHTHADGVVTITNTKNGKDRIADIYGDNVLIIPYVMPGFLLAKAIRQHTKDIDWNKYSGMILLNHGVFTWDDDAKLSYEKMISIVSKAEQYLKKHANNVVPGVLHSQENLHLLATIRKKASQMRGIPVLARLNSSNQAVHFANKKNVADISSRGDRKSHV